MTTEHSETGTGCAGCAGTGYISKISGDGSTCGYCAGCGSWPPCSGCWTAEAEPVAHPDQILPKSQSAELNSDFSIASLLAQMDQLDGFDQSILLGAEQIGAMWWRFVRGAVAEGAPESVAAASGVKWLANISNLGDDE